MWLLKFSWVPSSLPCCRPLSPLVWGRGDWGSVWAPGPYLQHPTGCCSSPGSSGRYQSRPQWSVLWSIHLALIPTGENLNELHVKPCHPTQHVNGISCLFFCLFFFTFCLPIKWKHNILMLLIITDHFKSFLLSVRVERGHQVNAYSFHQLLSSGVPVFVLFAQVLHKKQDQLPTYRLVSMETCCEAKLWLTCEDKCKRLWLFVS